MDQKELRRLFENCENWHIMQMDSLRVAANIPCVRRSDSGADRLREGTIVAVELRSAVRGLWE